MEFAWEEAFPLQQTRHDDPDGEEAKMTPCDQGPGEAVLDTSSFINCTRPVAVVH